MTGEPVIAIEDLSFSYDGALVLRDVNLSVVEKDFTSIVGPNGGGKTTLLKLILGLLHPNRGTVRVFGERPEAVRSRIGYVPQHAVPDLHFPISVMDVALTGRLGKAAMFGPYGEEDKEAALQALREVGLHQLRKRSFATLSGGERQKAFIARALASDPELLLLDEPTVGLDIVAEANLYDLLKELNTRMTILLVSHDVGFVSRYVKTVVCVKETVTTHPTSELTGELMKDVYGSDFRMVRHDQDG